MIIHVSPHWTGSLQIELSLLLVFSLTWVFFSGFPSFPLQGAVPACRVAMDTSLLCLNCLGPRQPVGHQFPSSSIGDEFNHWSGCFSLGSPVFFFPQKPNQTNLTRMRGPTCIYVNQLIRNIERYKLLKIKPIEAVAGYPLTRLRPSVN